ncbi:D-3-phosphoglycerate dehydrogenase [Sphingobacterium daejeonense]|nr:D-3-phosphoglycerate dehydrogenase [Sphingobacterium daejeonense]
MTRGEIGYAVTDIDAAYDKQMLKQLKQVDHTIKFRILYNKESFCLKSMDKLMFWQCQNIYAINSITGSK